MNHVWGGSGHVTSVWRISGLWVVVWFSSACVSVNHDKIRRALYVIKRGLVSTKWDHFIVRVSD